MEEEWRRCPLPESDIHAGRVEGLRQRVCLPLEESDPGRLLSLLRSLFENRADVIQIKINRYLAEVTGSAASLLITCFQKHGECSVSVIGENSLPRRLHLQWNEGTMKELARHEERVFAVEKRALEPELADGVEARWRCSEEERLLCVPVAHPVSEKPLLYVLLVRPHPRVDYKSKCCALVNECMRYCLGCLVNSVCYEDERREHERARQLMETTVSLLRDIGAEGTVEARVCEALGAERCSVFLREEGGQFVTALHEPSAPRTSKHVRLPSDYGLVGVAAETGTVVVSNDSRSDPRYCVDLDLKRGTVTRNALAFALMSGKDAVAVVEVYNKTPTETDSVFSGEDVETARALSLLLAPALVHSLDYGKTRRSLAATLATDSLYLFENKAGDDEVGRVVDCDLTHDWSPWLDLGRSLPEVSGEDAHAACLILSVFDDLGLMRRLDVRPAVLARLVVTLMRNPGPLPLHNWDLALRTFLFASALLNLLHPANTDVEAMALLVAALSFTADYRGAVDDVRRPAAGVSLAALYSSPGHVLQKWQSRRVLGLLQQPGTDILGNLSASRFGLFSRLLYKLINVADMGYWSECLSATEAWWFGVGGGGGGGSGVGGGGGGGTHVLPLLMASSVLGDYSKDFDHCSRVAEWSYAELVAGEEEAARAARRMPSLQAHFMSTLCLPTFRMLKEMFPVTYPCFERCSINLGTWNDYVDAAADDRLEPPQQPDVVT